MLQNPKHEQQAFMSTTNCQHDEPRTHFSNFSTKSNKLPKYMCFTSFLPRTTETKRPDCQQLFFPLPPPSLRSTVAPPGVAAGAPCHPPVCPSTRPLKLTEAKASIWGHTIRDISPSSSPAVPAALATSAILNDPLSSSCSLSLVYSCT